MKHLKLSTIFLMLFVYGCTILLFYILHPYYETGNYIFDLIMCLFVESMASYTVVTTINKEKYTTQAFAHIYQLLQYTYVTGILVLCHIISSLFINFNWNIIYYSLLLVVLMYYAIRIFFVHTGSAIQLETDTKIEYCIQTLQQVTNELKQPTVKLINLINTTDAKSQTKARVADTIRAIADNIESLSPKSFQRNPQLNVEISKWKNKLESMIEVFSNSMDHEILEKELEKILQSANQTNTIINSFK